MQKPSSPERQPELESAATRSPVLVLNSGSSSLKFGLYAAGAARMEVLVSGVAEAIGEAAGRFVARDERAGGRAINETDPIPGQREALARIVRYLGDAGGPSPSVIGHRIVHGGPKLREHCRIDDQVMRELEAAAAFAPLHAPSALSVIRLAKDRFPRADAVACFDTSFHATLPDIARTLPIAHELRSEGLRRYGFHGLSCESIMGQLGGDAPSRVIIAHLGAGASVTAVRDGRSVDTSMGLTPTGGVIMGARSGDLDPGILVYLMREKNYDAAMIEDLVDRRSGLKGISGVGGDMRALRAVAKEKPDARLAIAMFCASVAKQIAAMVTVLDGLDLLVFTGGIGENDPAARAAICRSLSWIGVSLDEERNRATNNPLDGAGSRSAVRVLPSQEDAEIARHAWTLSQTAIHHGTKFPGGGYSPSLFLTRAVAATVNPAPPWRIGVPHATAAGPI